jgi:phospholipid/cholesterol/gamma-HCH transport system ATP-binding protein
MRKRVPGDANDTAQVELRGVRLAFGRRVVFGDLSFRVPKGEIAIVMGGSGSGKSTVLRMVGGLQAPDAGQVSVAGRDLTTLDDYGVQQVRRHLGMLFQSGALLDSMTVFENIALPLREHTDMRESEIRSAVRRRLDSVGLDGVEDLLPRQLSGGMLRRVGLARAIVEDPDILLCDEPFSGLDPINVSRIEALLVKLNRDLGLTVMVTSHHMASSLRMGSRIVLLRDGGAVCGTPRELAASADPKIKEFLGADGAAYLLSLADSPREGTA